MVRPSCTTTTTAAAASVSTYSARRATHCHSQVTLWPEAGRAQARDDLEFELRRAVVTIGVGDTAARRDGQLQARHAAAGSGPGARPFHRDSVSRAATAPEPKSANTTDEAKRRQPTCADGQRPNPY